ncbi:MAG: cytochrome P450 [Gaiellaceae bacterium]
MIRDLLALRRDPLGTLTRLAREQGDVARFTLGRQEVFLVGDPGLIEDVLVRQGKSFVKHKVIRARRSAPARIDPGRGLMLSDDPDLHVFGRRLAQPAFRAERVLSFAGAAVADAAASGDRWRHGETIDLEQELGEIVVRSVSTAFFGGRTGDASLAGEIEALLAPFRLATSRALDLAGLLHLSEPIRFVRASDALERRMELLLAEAGRVAAASDVPSLLARAAAAGNERLAGQQLSFEALGILLAAVATTVPALAWAWYEIARHPEVERRLHETVDAELGGGPPEAGQLDRLGYVRAIVSETLRLYPPSWFIGRRSLADVPLGDRTVPRGAIVLVSPYIVHRDPRFFAAPERFDPDRWLGEEPAGRPRFAYFPFGGGARRCIGERFALMEATLLIATLAQRTRLSLVSDRPVELRAAASLRPRQRIRARVERRVPTAGAAAARPAAVAG